MDTEERMLGLMNLLHRAFADHANSKVDLTKLGADDFGLSRELKTIADAFIESGITSIPGENKPTERIQLVAGTLQIL
jgi:hypothetical protein